MSHRAPTSFLKLCWPNRAMIPGAWEGGGGVVRGGGGVQSTAFHVLEVFLFLLLPSSGEIYLTALGLCSEYRRCLCCCCVTVCQNSVLQLRAARSASVECLARAPLNKAHLNYEVPQRDVRRSLPTSSSSSSSFLFPRLLKVQRLVTQDVRNMKSSWQNPVRRTSVANTRVMMTIGMTTGWYHACGTKAASQGGRQPVQIDRSVPALQRWSLTHCGILVRTIS